MIMDTLKNIDTYLNIHPDMSKVLDFIKTVNENTPAGRIELSQFGGFALIMEYESEPVSQRKFETHKKFIDVQIILSGRERIDWVPVDNLESLDVYDMESDLAFWKDGKCTTLFMEKNYFAIFFPNDAHKPNCSIDIPVSMRKMVVKVPVS